MTQAGAHSYKRRNQIMKTNSSKAKRNKIETISVSSIFFNLTFCSVDLGLSSVGSIPEQGAS
jgi:hypothetical protein